MKKIVRGNDFTLRIPVMKIVNGERVAFPLPGCTDIKVNVVNQYRRVALGYTIDVSADNVLLARVEGDRVTVGTYALEVKGKLFDNDWRSNEYEQFQLVDNNAAGDTVFEPHEGEDSVEMDTALVVLAPSVELGNLIRDAEETIADTKEALKGVETKMGDIEQRADTAIGAATTAAERANTQADRAEQTNSAVDTAEKERASAEQERKTAEEQRKSEMQSNAEAELARSGAEKLRVEAEKRRASEETMRASAEDTRKTKEADRIAGETSREQQENSRVAAEQTRDSQEKQRKRDEAQRDDAEVKRAHAEERRAANEKTREKNEVDRAAAEDDRVSAETARTSAESKRETDTKEAIRNAQTATSEAEKVDATITDANVLEVTGRDGVKKSLELVDQAEASEMKKDVARIKESMGTYSDRPNITLTAKQNNVAISADGVKVAKNGWAIAEFTAELGNIYLFNPGETSSDVCVFAEYIDKVETRAIDYAYTYDESGRVLTAKATYNGKTYSYSYDYSGAQTVIIDQSGNTVNSLPSVYTTVVGAYNPMTILNADAELPADGYYRFVSNFTTASSIKIAVSYKVGSADLTMKVVRDGSTANMCSQLAKINKKVDEVSEKYAKTNYISLRAVTDGTILIDDKKEAIVANKIFYRKGFTTFKLQRPLDILDIDIVCNSFVGEMDSMFYFFSTIHKIKIDMDTSNVKIMSNAFRNISARVLDLSSFDTSNVTNMSGMFDGCPNLRVLDLSSFDTSNVTNMSGMFAGCVHLCDLDLSSFDTSNVTNMSRMFYKCKSIEYMSVSEGFGKMKNEVMNIDFSELEKWTVGVDSLKKLYDRKANGMGVITIKLHANAKAVLGENGIAQLTAKGYIIA